MNVDQVAKADFDHSFPILADKLSTYHVPLAPQSLSNTINLSEQQLVQCCNKATGCQVSSGCDGGLSDEVRRSCTL
jgi:hypothetical protein